MFLHVIVSLRNLKKCNDTSFSNWNINWVWWGRNAKSKNCSLEYYRPKYTYIILEKQSIPQRGRIQLEYLDQCNNHILLQR
jgi:hypothetical protein